MVKRTRRLTTLVGVIGLGSALLAACGGTEAGPGTSGAAEKVVVAQSDPSISFAPLYVAEEKGYFAEEGLKVEVQTVKPDVAVTALATDRIGYLSTIGSVARKAIAGVPIKTVMIWFEKTPFVVMANKKFKSMQDLKGQNLGVSGIGSTSDIALRFALRDSGLDPQKDVKIIQLGGGGAEPRITAVRTGQVAATPLTLPSNLVAESRGLVPLYDTTDKLLAPFTGLGVSESRLEKHPEQVKKMMRASFKALDFIKQHPEEAAQIIADYTKTDVDLNVEALPTMQAIISPDGMASEKALMNQVTSAAEEGQEIPSLNQVFDFTLLYEVLGDLGVKPGPDRAVKADVS